LTSGLCKELHEHVDTEAIDLASNQIADTRLMDTQQLGPKKNTVAEQGSRERIDPDKEKLVTC